MLPAAIALGVTLFFPLAKMVVNSFQDFGISSLFSGETVWVGFDNYVAMLTDPDFIPVLLRTLGFTVSLVVAIMGIGLALSELMTRISPKVRLILNIVLITTWAIPVVTSVLVWQWLFQPLYGVVNWMITQLGVFGDFTSHNWTGTPFEAFAIVWLLIVWQSVPFAALTLYAGQSQIPAEFSEAARLDGAGGIQLYRYVTLPFLLPQLYLVMILELIWQFNAFTQLWVLTRGGPDGGTTTLSIWSFKTAFASNDFGQGSAIAVVTAVMLLVLTAFYTRRLVKQGEL
ncbi:ABC transporter permease [Microbacterium sp. Root61]|nr:ABC transporter permease [Microbacterium sp. Root61]